MTQSTLAADARLVKAYLQEHGWCQGHYRDDEGRSCLQGAFNRVFKPFEGNGSGEKLFERMEALCGGAAEAFNDVPGRTVEDIYALLDAVIAEAEG